MIEGCSTFIHVGQIHTEYGPAAISTVLGSCVAVCLYDARLRLGGMNHYLLPLWNANGLQTPKFGNIAVPKLIEEMVAKGASTYSMQAKIFGGASISIGDSSDSTMIGQRNIAVAREILESYNIPIVAEDVGGAYGRKIQLNCEQGSVWMKYAK